MTLGPNREGSVRVHPVNQVPLHELGTWREIPYWHRCHLVMLVSASSYIGSKPNQVT